MCVRVACVMSFKGPSKLFSPERYLFRGRYPYICQSAMRVTCPLLLAAVHVVAQSSQSSATGEWTYVNPISAVTTSCKAQLGLEPKIASNQPCAAHYLEPLLIITSTSISSLRTYRSVNFTGTIFSRTSPKPIVFYHEASWDVGQGKAPFRKSDLPLHMSTSTCPVDLFEAVPQLQHLLTSCESCIDEYYRVAGGKEPLTGNTSPNWKLSGKVLSRKVVAIYPGDPEKGERSSLSGYWLGPPLIRASVRATFFCATRACARLRAPLRPAPGASEDGVAPNHLSICHQPARPFRRAP